MNTRTISIHKSTMQAALWALFFLSCLPQYLYSQISGYDILNLDRSARSSALGGAFASIAGDVDALFYNPAGLAEIEEKSAGFTYLNHVLDINSGSFVVVAPRGANKYGIGFHYINYGDFERREGDGTYTGLFGAQDIVLTGGYAQKYSENIYLGASAKALYSKIDTYSSTAFAGDIGLIYSIPRYMLNIGISLTNIGFIAQAYDTIKDDLPASFRAGISKDLAHLPLLWSFEYRRFLDGENQLLGGGEFSFSESFKGRIGYNSYGRDQKIGSEGGALSGFSFGFGFFWKKYTFDYAYTSMGIIGNVNRLSVVFSF
ncbi:PorV/PorQ family protein [candidate division KSB1 bacterium]